MSLSWADVNDLGCGNKALYYIDLPNVGQWWLVKSKGNVISVELCWMSCGFYFFRKIFRRDLKFWGICYFSGSFVVSTIYPHSGCKMYNDELLFSPQSSFAKIKRSVLNSQFFARWVFPFHAIRAAEAWIFWEKISTIYHISPGLRKFPTWKKTCEFFPYFLSLIPILVLSM